MKSTNKKKFSFQDFEEGLMLSGYLTPMNANEIQEKKMLDDYDRQTAEAKRALYFRRAVLAAEIVNELKDERTFGRIKFQKLVYLCENVAHMNLMEERYRKFAAGPFDFRFMHSINKEFKKQKWFDVKISNEGNYSKSQYFELENKSKYKEYYKSYFAEFDKGIHRLIALLKNEKTDFVELVATIFYCWKELIDNKEVFQREIMYDKVYSWSKEKAKFSTRDIDNAIKWMEEKKITPISI
jgi:hypothetical protein